jgi:hypothetical protein
VGTVIVVGLKAEALLARRLGVPVMIGGGTAAGAEMAARRAVAEGATALVSFGLAGGLDPSLRPASSSCRRRCCATTRRSPPIPA